VALKQQEISMSRPYDDADPSIPYTSHAKMLAMCGENRRIIDFGCWTGVMSRELKKSGCYVIGIELDPDAAREARSVCDRVIEADLDDLDLGEALGGEKFDVGLFGDIVEHLKNPQKVLVQMREALSPGGFIVVSVPNIAHISIRLQLLMGEFDYVDRGILDATHLKFFTRKSIIDLLESCGYLVESMDWTDSPIPESEIRGVLDPLNLGNLEEVLKSFTSWEAVAFQYVIKAVSASEADLVQKLSRDKVEAEHKLVRLEADHAILVDHLARAQEVGTNCSRQLTEAIEYVKTLEGAISEKNEYIGLLESRLSNL